MKTITLSILLLLLLSTTAQAQPGPGKGKSGWDRPDAAKRVAHMSIELELTEEQSSQLLEVLTAAEAERENLSAQHSTDMCSLRDITNAQIEEILTADQSVRLEEMKTQMETRREEKRGQRGGNHSQRPDCDA